MDGLPPSRRRQAGRWLFGLLLVLSLGQAAFYYPRLPARMASHFGPGGQPDDWMAKPAFLALMLGMHLLVPGLLFGLHLLSPRLPTGLMNLPHRDYWLAPERRERTLARIADMFLGIALLMNGLLLVLEHFIFRANVQGAGLPPAATALVLGFVALILVLAIGTTERFYRIPPKSQA